MNISVNDFNIQQISDSGQCFRWNRIGEMHYRGIFNGKVCEIFQHGNILDVSGVTKDEFNCYFDIDRDYSQIKELYARDKILKDAISLGEGIRILRQDNFETLISFIISANNNIPRIKKSVELISMRFGKKIYDNFYAFPNMHELSNVTEDELRACGVGFRAKYIVNTCRILLSDEHMLERISDFSNEECKRELLSLQGVGPKVADCVMLFSMGKVDVFPVDVWIKRLMEELYIHKETNIKEIATFGRSQFGEFAGIAQQYLFYARNTIKRILL